MPVLDLPDGTRTKCYRRTLEIMQSDPVLLATVQTWQTMDGQNTANNANLPSQYPLLKFIPSIGPMGWFGPSDMYGPLIIKIGMQIQSRFAEDFLNLWEAIENAVYPYNDENRQKQIEQSLKDCGAETGQWEFNIPASDPDPQEAEEGTLICVGQMRLSVRRTINP